VRRDEKNYTILLNKRLLRGLKLKTMSKHPFEYQKPLAVSVVAIKALREVYSELYSVLLELPESRERSVAITNLETSAMWANKSIVFTQD